MRNDTYFIAILVILVGVISFGLGRLSMTNEASITQSQDGFKQIESLKMEDAEYNPSNIPVVVSKSGTKYHLHDCPGALQMKSENKIELNSIDAARAAGYTPAANCPDLQ